MRTRDLVLEWCDVREADLTLAEARTADEVEIRRRDNSRWECWM